MRSLTLNLVLGSALALAIGCAKQEEQIEAVSPPGERPIATNVASSLAATQEATVVPPQSAQAVEEAQQPEATAPEVPKADAPERAAEAQQLIDTAKQHVAEGKWQEAVTALSRLQNYELTSEQEASLLQMKEDLEKMVREFLSGKNQK